MLIYYLGDGMNNKPFNCPILVRSCDEKDPKTGKNKCPFADLERGKCMWGQVIKPYYQTEREKGKIENSENIHQERQTKFIPTIHIITFNSPALQPSNPYDSRIWTLLELYEILEKVTCSCGKRFERSDLQMFNHNGGMFVRLNDGTVSKQWVFVKCQRCGYDMAFWKILRLFGRY